MAQHLTNMAIDKVSTVDAGANGRRIAVLKRDGAPDDPEPVRTPAEIAELWKAADAADPVTTRRTFLDIVKGWLGAGSPEPVAKAQTFATIVAGRELTDALYDGWWQLEDALWSAMWAVDANGADLTLDTKKELVAQNLDEFKAWLLGQMNDATAIAKRADASPDQRALSALLRKAAGDDAERLTKAAEPLLAALGDVGSADPEDLTKRALPEEDDMDPAELAKALAPALQPMIETAVDAAIEKRAAARPQPAPAPGPVAPVAKSTDEAPEGPVTNADILKVLVGIDERLTAVEKGRSSQQSLGGQEGGVAKRGPLAGLLD